MTIPCWLLAVQLLDKHTLSAARLTRSDLIIVVHVVS